MADASKPTEPVAEDKGSVTQEETAKNKSANPKVETSSGGSVYAYPSNDGNANDAKKQADQQRDLTLRIAPIVVSLVALGVSWFSYGTAQTALVMGQRAWVVLSYVSPPGETDEERRTLNIDAEGKTLLTAGFVNVGKSPALNVIVVGLSKIQDVGAPPPCNRVGYAGTTNSRATIPNDSRDKPLKSGIEVEDMTQENIRAITETKMKRLFVHGLVLYDDVFDNKRRTTFCQFYVHGDVVTNFQNCPCGNDLK